MDQALLEARNPVPQQLDFSLPYLHIIKSVLKLVFPVSILILNFYSFACLWNILAPLHEDYTLVINISIPQPPFLGCINHVFLPLPSYWLIHAFSELLLQKKAGRKKKKKKQAETA